MIEKTANFLSDDNEPDTNMATDAVPFFVAKKVTDSNRFISQYQQRDFPVVGEQS